MKSESPGDLVCQIPTNVNAAYSVDRASVSVIFVYHSEGFEFSMDSRNRSKHFTKEFNSMATCGLFGDLDSVTKRPHQS